MPHFSANSRQHSPRTYFRVTVNTSKGRRSYYAKSFKMDRGKFLCSVVNKEGETTGLILAGASDDFVKLELAKMNLMYGWLEVVR